MSPTRRRLAHFWILFTACQRSTDNPAAGMPQARFLDLLARESAPWDIRIEVSGRTSRWRRPSHPTAVRQSNRSSARVDRSAGCVARGGAASHINPISKGGADESPKYSSYCSTTASFGDRIDVRSCSSPSNTPTTCTFLDFVHCLPKEYG